MKEIGGIAKPADAAGVDSVTCLAERFDFFLGLVTGHAVSFLYFSDQLDAFPLDKVHVIVGQLAPLLLHPTFELLPIAFDLIPVHRSFSRAAALPLKTTAVSIAAGAVIRNQPA
jgi:hypothetical protein